MTGRAWWARSWSWNSPTALLPRISPGTILMPRPACSRASSSPPSARCSRNELLADEIRTFDLWLGQSGQGQAHQLERCQELPGQQQPEGDEGRRPCLLLSLEDRKSTRLNSSHSQISYAVFC